MKLLNELSSLLKAIRRRGFLLTASICLLSVTTLYAQELTVTGTVVDMDGEPFPAANVIIKGTTTGVVTNMDGEYSITVPSPESVLVFSFIGYLPEEVQVGNQSVIDVTLIESIEALEEIVVIGYGSVRRESVTGSVASFGGDDVREVASSDFTQAMQGRVAGVEFAQTSTKPGASMQIRIRGTRSLTADNDPLIVLDGIPFAGEINDIDPSDIQSVDILKDASATAIYGSRGANGVIIITTHKGRQGQKAQVSYNSYMGMKDAIKYPMMSGPELADLRDEAGLFTVDGIDESRDVDTDWQDLFYRTGSIQNHDFRVTGGTETGSYNFGVGYLEDKAVIPTQQYERFSLRASLDQDIGRFISIGMTSNNSFGILQGDQIGLYGVLSNSPMISPYNDDGSLRVRGDMPADQGHYILTRDRLDQIGDNWIRETNSYGTYNNLYGELKAPGIEGLKYRVNVGLNLRTQKRGDFTGQGINSANADALSSASLRNRLTTNWVIENLLTYDRTFADRHTVNLVGLYSAEETQYTQSHASARDIPNPDFQYHNLGTALGEQTINPEYQNYELSALQSMMGRIMYSYDNRYTIMGTLRSDGSSRLAEGYKWHTYPAVSAGWNLGNENFIRNVMAIDVLRLRAGYGQTSNQAVDPYSTLGLLSARPYNFGSTFATGYYVSEIANEELGWEYSETYNFGLDFTILSNRLSGSVEYYITQTNDLLLYLNLPPTSGVSRYMANIGETENKGVEVTLNGKIIENLNGFSWDVGLNVYHNKNTLVALASGQDEDRSNAWFVGYPINSIFDYNYVGLWQEDENVEAYERGGVAGMIKVEYTGDYEEDGTPVRTIGPDDRMPQSTDPDFQGGFNTRLAYNNFDLSVIGSFQRGGMLISTLHAASGYLNLHTGRRNNVQIDYWTPENTDARYPTPKGPISGDNPKYGSTLGYFDATYLKVRNITLGYNLDHMNWISNAGISRLRLYITAQNPLVMFSPFHKETGLDPIPNSYGDENAATTNTYDRRFLTVGTNTPSTRNYLIGINVTF